MESSHGPFGGHLDIEMVVLHIRFGCHKKRTAGTR
jgi:hypothetical protein